MSHCDLKRFDGRTCRLLMRGQTCTGLAVPCRRDMPTHPCRTCLLLGIDTLERVLVGYRECRVTRRGVDVPDLEAARVNMRRQPEDVVCYAPYSFDYLWIVSLSGWCSCEPPTRLAWGGFCSTHPMFLHALRAATLAAALERAPKRQKRSEVRSASHQGPEADDAGLPVCSHLLQHGQPALVAAVEDLGGVRAQVALDDARGAGVDREVP
jgi:hypothetical protein